MLQPTASHQGIVTRVSALRTENARERYPLDTTRTYAVDDTIALEVQCGVHRFFLAAAQRSLSIQDMLELRPRLILASSAASTLTHRLPGLSGRERSAGIHSGATASTHTDASTAPERRNADTDTNTAQAGAPIPSSEITGADTQLLVVSEQTEPEEPLTLSRSQLEVSRPQHEK